MDKNISENTDIAIAVLQETSTVQTATLLRIESKLEKTDEKIDRISEKLQSYATIADVERKYVTKEIYGGVVEKVETIGKLLWLIVSSVIILAIQTIWSLFGGSK